MAAAAAAYGTLCAGSASAAYLSQVSKVSPPAPAGVAFTVLGGDDRLQLDNGSGQTVIVRGYQGEPYLRFGRGAVYENVHSPASYLNRDRFGTAAVPESASAGAAPAWRKVAAGNRYAWRDHRIQWMSHSLPPDVANTPGEPRLVFYWRVPITIGGRPAAVLGTLNYLPDASTAAPATTSTGDTDSSSWPWEIPLAIGLLAAAAIGCWLLLRRPRRPAG